MLLKIRSASHIQILNLPPLLLKILSGVRACNLQLLEQLAMIKSLHILKKTLVDLQNQKAYIA